MAREGTRSRSGTPRGSRSGTPRRSSLRTRVLKALQHGIVLTFLVKIRNAIPRGSVCWFFSHFRVFTRSGMQRTR